MSTQMSARCFAQISCSPRLFMVRSSCASSIGRRIDAAKFDVASEPTLQPKVPPAAKDDKRGLAIASQLTRSTVLSAQISILDISADLPSEYFPRRST